jgi:hypothetical protein
MTKWWGTCFTALYCLFISESAVASWAKMSDLQLSTFPVIVYGEYIGTSALKLDNNTALTTLGVINASVVLKGPTTQEVYFIKTPPLNTPVRSDMLFFKPGQVGIWFLQPVINSQGLYQINHPSQYLSAETSDIERWKALVK